MSLVKFPPSMASSSSAGETSPLLGPATTEVMNQHQTSTQPGGPSVFPLFCVIGAVLLERITYYGILANLVIFLTADLKFSTPIAIGVVLVFTGLAWFMSTVGGFIGDAVSGRYNAIWGSLLIYIVGTVALVTAAHFQHWQSLQTFIKVLFSISLFIISVGEGTYKANISAFGAEQVEGHTDNVYRNYFNWYYWCINLGSFIAYSGIAYYQLNGSFFWGFLIPLICILLATVVFTCGRRRYVVNSPTGYFKKVYQIIREARRLKRQDASPNYPGLEEHVPRKSWLDRAMMKYGGSYLDCEVEEVKILGKVLVVFLVLIPYWSIYYQMNTTFLIQGIHMKIRQVNNSTCTDEFILPPSWLSLVDVMIVLILIPIMDRIVYPYLDRKGSNLSVASRISIGFMFAVISMIIAGVVEEERWHAPQNFTQRIGGDRWYKASTLSIYYQIPQYACIGISEVFASVGGLEFAYRYAPKHMHGFVMGLFYLVESVGSWVGTGLFVAWLKMQGYSLSSEDLNLRNYFFLLAGVMFLTSLVFVIVTRRVSFLQHHRKRLTFIVHQKPKEDRREKLRQAPLFSSDLQSDIL